MEDLIRKILENNRDLFKDISKVIKINVGFTNTIYNINDEYILKLCTDVTNEDNFKKEITFYLNNKDNDLIPLLYRYNTSKDIVPYYYEIIEKVKGVSLYNVWHTYSDTEKENIIKQLCAAIKNMHSVVFESYDWLNRIKNEFIDLVNSAKSNKLLTNEETKKLEGSYEYFDKYLIDNPKFALIHNDLHFDNILVNDGKIKIIDFERSMIAPIDFELDILYRMIRMPSKFASEETEKYTENANYFDIYKYIEKYYKELVSVDNLHERLALYDMVYFLNQYVEAPKYIELKSYVFDAIESIENKKLTK